MKCLRLLICGGKRKLYSSDSIFEFVLVCSEHFSFRESRYLLLLTENYGGLTILSENLLAGRRVVRIFGSSFPKDQEYTQVGKYVV